MVEHAGFMHQTSPKPTTKAKAEINTHLTKFMLLLVKLSPSSKNRFCLLQSFSFTGKVVLTLFTLTYSHKYEGWLRH